MSIIYTNIQRMCVHDGPGVRTTVFLKGCNLACPWCCNPENMRREVEYYFQREKCERIKNRKRFCSKCKISTGEFPTVETMKKCICPFGYIGKYGKCINAEHMMDVLYKDRGYWGRDGGVTFSGGEALLQIEKLLPVLEALNREKISVVFETALHVPWENVKLASLYTDCFLVDVKILDEDMCNNIIHGNVRLFLSNVEKLVKTEKNIKFRVPCCDEYTLTKCNQKLLLDFFAKYTNIPIEIFAIHSLGKKKYESLNRKCFENPSKEKMTHFYDNLVKQGNQVAIIHI